MQENHSVIILILGYLTYCDFTPDFSLKKWNQHYQVEVLILRQLVRILEIAAVREGLRQLLENASSVEFAVAPAAGADCDLFMSCHE